MKPYKKLSDIEKLSLIQDLYVNRKKSFADIAKEYDTYPNKIRRDAKSFNIVIRDKSEAQKNALVSGKHKHPTKGQKRSDQVKDKIGNSVMNSWDKLSEDELKARKQIAKNNWDKLSDIQKNNMQKAATTAVREASKVGSKLEKYFLSALLKDGYVVEFHKEQTLVNTKLQIDLFLPKLNIAIEVDGPSHFEPVWGQDALEKNITYDNKKEGLIIGRGWYLIRIKQTKDFSPSRAKTLYTKLNKAIKTIIDQKSSTTQSISIED